MATTAVAVFGYLALRELPVALLPDLSYPTLTVQTTYPDASPLSVERLVTRPIEEAVGVIPGVRDMHSVSRAGTSEVVLEFEWDESMDLSTLAVREKLGLVELPREAERPRVLRYDPAQDPVMRLSLAGSDDLELLREHAERWLKRELEGVDGVAAAKVQGGIEAEVEVAVDPLRLAQLGLTFADVSSALQRQDVNLPGGSVVDRGAIFLVRTLHECDAAIYGEAERLARAHLGRFGCAPAASAPREAELVPPHLRSSGRPNDPLAGPSLFARVAMQVGT